MLDRADAILKLSLAVAVLMLAAGVGYYFAIFLPANAAKTEASAQAVEQAKLDLLKQAATKKDAAVSAASNEYNTCLSVALSDYSSRWQQNCDAQHEQDIRSKNNCVIQGNAEQYCATFVIRPAINCQLQKFTADGYDADLRNEKQLCLEKLKASQN